jgi:hypothetical protein
MILSVWGDFLSIVRFGVLRQLFVHCCLEHRA